MSTPCARPEPLVYVARATGEGRRCGVCLGIIAPPARHVLVAGLAVLCAACAAETDDPTIRSAGRQASRASP